MSRNRDKNISKRPSLFSSKPGSRNEALGNRKISLKDLQSLTNIQSTASFKYDSPGRGIKSTQQIKVDWSKFEEHCFFDSAQSKINVAFDTIINDFPFDGTSKDIESFFDNLTGYENYIYQRFPKHVGYLNFSGTQKGEDPSGGFSSELGNHIKVFDSRGYLFPGFSSNRDGESSVEFLTSPFTVEFFINVPTIENDNQIILQKQKDNNTSITLALSQSLNTSNCNLIFSITSGSSMLFSSCSLEKGKFNHISAVYDRGIQNRASIFVNAKFACSSSNKILFDTLDTSRAPVYIASGSLFPVSSRMMPGGKASYAPVQTFSGSIDELRIFHVAKNQKEISDSRIFSVYNDDKNSLKLYFKFNEATGSFRPNNVALDSSGNSLHSIINNYKITQRITGSVPNPVKNEKIDLSPIIFPDHYLVKRLNQNLLLLAERYDSTNPNIITKLVPPHLFLEGQRESGFSTLQGEIYKPISGQSIPGSAEIGSAQILTAFLLTYAKFFDELKIVIDSISNFLNVDYENLDIVPEQFLPMVARYYGIQLPSLFTDSNIFEFIDGENLGDDPGYAPNSLRNLQNELWKRFLINLPYIKRAKGTVHSVKSTIRSFGINPDRLMTVREFGGPTKRSLETRRNRHVEPIRLLNFSGSKAKPPGTEDRQGFFLNIPNIISPFLSASRVEPGFPKIQGTFVSKTDALRNGISNNIDDGLLTSGSFSYEGFYRFLEPGRSGFRHSKDQSLVRFSITGSGIAKNPHIVNIVASSGSVDIDPKVTLFVKSSLTSATGKHGLKIQLTGPNQYLMVIPGIFLSEGQEVMTSVTSVSESYLSPKMSTWLVLLHTYLRCSRVSKWKY